MNTWLLCWSRVEIFTHIELNMNAIDRLVNFDMHIFTQITYFICRRGSFCG